MEPQSQLHTHVNHETLTVSASPRGLSEPSVKTVEVGEKSKNLRGELSLWEGNGGVRGSRDAV